MGSHISGTQLELLRLYITRVETESERDKCERVRESQHRHVVTLLRFVRSGRTAENMNDEVWNRGPGRRRVPEFY